MSSRAIDCHHCVVILLDLKEEVLFSLRQTVDLQMVVTCHRTCEQTRADVITTADVREDFVIDDRFIVANHSHGGHSHREQDFGIQLLLQQIIFFLEAR